jgi:hypothetical protein
MNRLPRFFARRSALRLAGALVLAVALTLPVIAWRTAALAVASLSLSPTVVTTGSTSTAVVRLDANPTRTVTVNLSSANPGLATVPSTVSVSPSPKGASKSFTVQTVSGATGCTEISARLGTTAARKALIAVKPPAGSSNLQLKFSHDPAVGGQTVTGTVTLFANAIGETYQIRLSSSNPTYASVPASVTVTTVTTETAIFGIATFPITTSATGTTICPVITATVGDPRRLTIGGTQVSSTKALLRLVSISG